MSQSKFAIKKYNGSFAIIQRGAGICQKEHRLTDAFRVLKEVEEQHQQQEFVNLQRENL